MNSILFPKYQCYKEVWAFKIAAIDVNDDDSAVLHPVIERFGKVWVSAFFMEKYKPHVDGYYVLHKEGNASFASASAFEGNHALVQDDLH